LCLKEEKIEEMPKSGPIIIVEDDPDDQDLLKEVFNELKIVNRLCFFSNAREALDYLLTTSEKPFLIISDINMPAMSGLDFLKFINEHDQLKGKGIPFIFLTTSNDQLLMKEAYDTSAQGYFVKPISIGTYGQLIKTIVDYWMFASRAYSFSNAI
jgi:CheY-like chemotaxis protein